MNIVCGWCAALTGPALCVACGRDPVLPWTQRGQVPPTEAEAKRIDARRRMAEARRQLGFDATAEQIAEAIGVSPRTVRRWLEMSAPRPSTPLDLI